MNGALRCCSRRKGGAEAPQPKSRSEGRLVGPGHEAAMKHRPAALLPEGLGNFGVFGEFRGFGTCKCLGKLGFWGGEGLGYGISTLMLAGRYVLVRVGYRGVAVGDSQPCSGHKLSAPLFQQFCCCFGDPHLSLPPPRILCRRGAYMYKLQVLRPPGRSLLQHREAGAGRDNFYCGKRREPLRSSKPWRSW